MPRKAASKATPSHLDSRGSARMVDVGRKAVTARVAVARGRVFMQAATLELIRRNRVQKGDVLTVARLAAIAAAKRTGELIPLAHTLPLDGLDVDFELDGDGSSVAIVVRAGAIGRTGVEMEALTGAAVAALTIYDMLKSVDRGMVIG